MILFMDIIIFRWGNTATVVCTVWFDAILHYTVHDEILLDIQRGVIRFVIPLLQFGQTGRIHRSNPMLIFLAGII